VEDYYQLLGVQSDDARDTIREAYRAQKSELDGKGTDDARAKASKLNRAWNVLSDANQRAKYDDQLADAKAEGTVEDSGDEVVSAPIRGRGGRGGRADRANRPVRQPILQETEVNGIPLASNKDRGFALAIDGGILFVLLLIALTSFSSLASTLFEDDWRAFEAQVDVMDAADADLKAAEDALDDAEKRTDTEKIAQARESRDVVKKGHEQEVKKATALFNKSGLPAQRILILVWAVVACALTIVPSARSGKTFGKRLRRTRLLAESGERAGWRGSIRHFGLPLGSMVLIGLYQPGFMQIVGLVWLFGVTSFARNPRRQGWHDRFAKTIVAAD
jgi:curved DNA-binding protein CbpA